jgi:hypothetical protein
MEAIRILKSLLIQSERFHSQPHGEKMINTVISLLEKGNYKPGQIQYITNVANTAKKFYSKCCSKSLSHNRAVNVYNTEVLARVESIIKSLS